MATRDEMVSALRGAHEAGDTEAATRIAGMIRRADAPYSPDNATRVERPDENYGNEGRSRPENLRQTVERLYTEGAAPKIGKVVKDAGVGLLKGTRDMAEALDKQVITGPASPIPEGHPVAKAAQAYVSPESIETNKLYDEAGPVAGVTRFIPEAAVSAIPIAGAGGKIATGAKYLLPKAAAKFAPAIGDIAANAAYEGGKAAATGETLADTGSAALTGGAGAAAGRVLTRALGGIKPLLRQESQDLINRGVYPTPGQAIGGVAQSLEDKALSLPIVGDIGQLARKRSLEDFNRSATNEAINPVLTVTKGKPVTSTGSDAIEAAQRKVSDVYDSALDGMAVQPAHMQSAVDATQMGMGTIALLDPAQRGTLNQFVGLRILPHVVNGKVLTGQEAKAIDAEIGHVARKYSRSINPGDHPLGDAMYELQGNWREAMAQGSSPDKTRLLDAANASYKNLLPLVKASDKAVAQGGTFTPYQLSRSLGQYAQNQGGFAKAAQTVLPSRVPDSGTAGRLMLGAIAGGAGISGAGLGTTAAAGLAAYALSSRTGLRLLYNGLALTLKPEIRQWLQGLPPERVAQFFQAYGEKVPSVHQMAAQIGRHIASQQPEETTQ